MESLYNIKNYSVYDDENWYKDETYLLSIDCDESFYNLDSSWLMTAAWVSYK